MAQAKELVAQCLMDNVGQSARDASVIAYRLEVGNTLEVFGYTWSLVPR
jgi:hypothetical protein